MWNKIIDPKETLLIVMQDELPDDLQKILADEADGSHIAFIPNLPDKDRILYNNGMLSDEVRNYPKQKLLMVAIDNKVDLVTAINEDIELIAKNDPELRTEDNRYAMEKLTEMKEIVAKGKADKLNEEMLSLVPNFYINAANINQKTHQVITCEIHLKQFQL